MSYIDFNINALKSAAAPLVAIAETNDHPVAQLFAKTAQSAVSFFENCATRQDAGEELDEDDYMLIGEFKGSLVMASLLFKVLQKVQS